MIKKIFAFCIYALIITWSASSWSTTCKTADGTTIQSGSVANVYVTLQPSISAGQNLVVDLSSNIFCKNDVGGSVVDYLSLVSGSAYAGVLQNFQGTVNYNGSSYPFPLLSETNKKSYNSTSYTSWPVMLYLTPVSTASGVVISAGTKIARLVLRQTNNFNADDKRFYWDIYALNSVVVPTGGCDVFARNVTVNLPDYPGTIAVPVSVYCAQNQNLGYYLSGTTADSANSIFTNTASASPAGGIGVQLKRNGSVLSTNSTVSLGTVGTSAVNLGLTATYARTTGQVTAGNVQSIIGVTFVYQ